MRRVKKVEYINGYQLKLHFDNGKIKIIDLADELKIAKNKFIDLVSIDYFKKVRCDCSTIIWPNGIDFCPDWLYENSENFGPPTSKRALPLAKKYSEEIR